jgi:hypothetical protein
MQCIYILCSYIYVNVSNSIKVLELCGMKPSNFALLHTFPLPMSS